MFSAANLKTALEINQKENLLTESKLIEQHLALLRSPEIRSTVRYCLNPSDITKSPCLAVIQGLRCPDECPLQLQSLCKVIGAPPDRDLAMRLILGRIPSNPKNSVIQQEIINEVL